METQSSHTPLQRHPKCSALYASRLRHDSEASKPTEFMAPSVAYLANVTVEVTTKTLTRDASTFALTVHDNKSSSTWRHLRSYSECRAFQIRVLKVLSRGHLCFAECPWLYAYVQRALPAERAGHHLFRVAGHSPKPRVVENQRQALARLFATLQRVLLNPLNQKCTTLMQQVAPEVITFITNRSDVNAKEALNSPTSDRLLAKTFSESFMFEIEEDKKSDDESFGQTSTLTTASLDDLDENIPAKKTPQLPHWTKWWLANRISLVAKRQLPNESQMKNVWQSPAPSQQFFGGRGSEDTVLVTTHHDGTPTEPFPGSPRTLESLEPQRLDCFVLESVVSVPDRPRHAGQLAPFECNAVPTEQRHTASAATSKSSGLENIRRMPRRSLLVFNSIRSKLTTRKHCVI
ncbi:hypothetical protein GQ600_3933 [Phytophthora cactorum]|nr:hypothetical protein GQ600_3933 [Phytophthora cactorum]